MASTAAEKLQTPILSVLLHLSLTATTLCHVGSAQTGGTSRGTLAGIDADAEKAMAALHVPGASVGVIENGKVILAKGYGFRDIASSDPVDADTVFAVGSITKSFTATAVAAMVDDGKLDWDKPVINYLPWFRLYDPVSPLRSAVSRLPSHQHVHDARRASAPHSIPGTHGR